MHRFTLFFLAFSLLVGCTPQNDQEGGYQSSKVSGEADASVPATMTPADLLLKKALTAHGGDRYYRAEYVFAFRKKDYRFRIDGDNFRYESTLRDNGSTIVDVLENGNFSRTTNGEAVELTPKQIAAGTESLNSVIYFATLPAKLTDPAVNLEMGEATTIKDQKYQVLRVHFDEEGGGTDHDDNFSYWINEATGRIDYLAYDYKVNEGGVRFRSAYNPRVVDGILFQDYVNYKAPLGTELENLPAIYEAGELEELSRIETESVVSLN